MSLTSIHNNSSSIRFSSLPSSSSFSSHSHTNYTLSRNPKPSYLSLPRVPPSNSVVCLARRRSNSGRPIKNKSHKKKGSNESDDLKEDAFEALFKQLEEDLKRDEDLLDDDEDDDDDNEISEEELVMLEQELEEALAEDENLSELLNLTENASAVEGDEVEQKIKDEVGEDVIDDDKEEEEEEEEEPIKLKGWQLRRLAYALKAGRRKTSIKNLAAELCLDRSIVLELLREPPPNLLMMSASLPDKPTPAIKISEPKELPFDPSEVIADSAPPESKVDTPVHALQGNWTAQKRLKKVQVETLENVYRRTKRPTNSMVSSIVHVTNIPRARVVKWFEDKRADEGEPEQHQPYRRSSSKSVLTQ